MRLGFLGTGSIAAAVVEGIAGDGHVIIVSERNAERAATLAAAHANVTVAANQQVIDASDVIFLGLMAEAAGDILGALRFRPGQKVVSLMAGASLDRVARMVAPAEAAAIMLPFPGIARGGSPILVLGDDGLVGELFGTRNTVFALQGAAELDAYLCAQAVLSPAVQMVADAARWLGARIADPAQGEAFLRQLVGSSLVDSACTPLLAALDTPGGFNRRLRTHMQEAGTVVTLAAGLDRLEAEK
jgi:pyrroline-5-carboxylate reductase